MKDYIFFKEQVLEALDFAEISEDREAIASILLTKFKVDTEELHTALAPLATKWAQKLMEAERQLQKSSRVKFRDVAFYMNISRLCHVVAIAEETPCCLKRRWEEAIKYLNHIKYPTDLLELRHRNIYGSIFIDHKMPEAKKNLKKSKELFDKLRNATPEEREALRTWMNMSDEQLQVAINCEHIHLIDQYISYYNHVDHQKYITNIVLLLKYIVSHNLMDKMFMTFVLHSTDLSTATTMNGFAQSNYILSAAAYILDKYSNDPKTYERYSKAEIDSAKGTIKLLYVQHLGNLAMATEGHRTLPDVVTPIPGLPEIKRNVEYEKTPQTREERKKLILEAEKMHKEAAQLVMKEDRMLFNMEINLHLARKLSATR